MSRRSSLLLLLLALPLLAANSDSKVDGKFVVGGVDAQLRYVRAARVKLDEKGKQGYAVLLSAKPSAGDTAAWRTKQPSEVGSFLYVQFESNGAVWVAELGHVKARSGRFGVVTELQKASFDVKDNRLTARITTNADQVFTDDHYDVDLTFSAPLEP